MIWWLLLILVLLVIGWIIFMTPYPFVWLLRRQKDSAREKGPEGIKEMRSIIQKECDLTYPSKYPKATYDRYVHPTQPITHCIVWVHGGSFIGGTSSGAKNFATLHAMEGALVCAMNYALAPEHCFPTQILQVDEFMKYLKSDILPLYTKEDIPLYLGGDSAGGNICASYACMQTNPKFAQEVGIQLPQDQTITGLMLCCAPFDFCEDFKKEEWAQFRKFFRYIGWAYLGKRQWWKSKLPHLASPMHHVTSNYPPTYICDGKKYSFLWQGIKFAEVLKQNHVFVQTRFYDEMTHGFQFDYVMYKEEATQVYQDTLAFMKTCRKEEPSC